MLRLYPPPLVGKHLLLRWKYYQLRLMLEEATNGGEEIDPCHLEVAEKSHNNGMGALDLLILRAISSTNLKLA